MIGGPLAVPISAKIGRQIGSSQWPSSSEGALVFPPLHVPQVAFHLRAQGMHKFFASNRAPQIASLGPTFALERNSNGGGRSQ